MSASDSNYIHTKSIDVPWKLLSSGEPLGHTFDSVWCRQLVDAAPSLWEVKLSAGQEISPHVFHSQTVQMFTAGAVSIDGEDDCQEGDVRWAEGNVVSGKWKASSKGARFYLIGISGAPRAESSIESSICWQREHPDALPWNEVAVGESVAPPGLSCALCPDGPSVTLLVFDPCCSIRPHSHPGNIIYIMLKGQMRIPGEGVYEQGDVRWGAKDYDYGPEVMGTTGSTMIAIQKDVPLAVNWSSEGNGP